MNRPFRLNSMPLPAPLLATLLSTLLAFLLGATNAVAQTTGKTTGEEGKIEVNHAKGGDQKKNQTRPGGNSSGPTGEDLESVRDRPGNVPKPAFVRRGKGVVEITFFPDETQKERIVPPAEVRAMRLADRIPKIHGGNLFTAEATIRPRQLAPGESGTLHVFVTLEDDAVVTANAFATLGVSNQNLPAALGPTQLVPARVGTLPGHFRGQPVHESTLEFRAPITVDANATHDKYPLHGQVELEIHDGETGALAGVFFCGINGYLKVGKSLARVPRPNAVDAAKTSRQPDPAAADPGPGEVKHGSTRNSGDTKPTGLENTGRAEELPSPNAQPPTVTPSQTSYLFVGIGGLLLMGLLLVLVIRRS